MSAHEDFTRDENAKSSSDRAFGMVFAVVFACVALWPLIDGGAPRWWAFALCAGFLGLALAAPAVLAPANRLWTRFGLLLHRITSPLILGLMFYGAVTPTGLIMRLLGKDLLRLRFDGAAKSYWIERRPPGPAPDSMPLQF